MATRMLLLGAAASGLALSAPACSAAESPLAVSPLAVSPPRALGGAHSFAEIVAQVAPAVVSVDTKRRTPVRRPTIPGFPFDLFPQPSEPPPNAETRAAGSGFFISPDGYLITNNHVIADATEITVTLKDQRELPARVIGRDEATDLAVLKVEGREFPYVNFSSAAEPRVGDWVIAVGSPFGLGGTATAGIVSAYGRDIGSTFVDYIQIDAPINRGNSGGPTFDAHGRVIGVNTAIFTPSGGNVGIGFAIPAVVAAEVARDLMDDGRIERGYIGASVQTLTSEMAESLGLAGRKGVLVADVVSGGPAERAGLKAGDVIVRLEGRPAEKASRLTRRVASAKPGESLRFDVLRNGEMKSFTLRAEARPSERVLAGQAPTPGPQGADAPGGGLGLAVRPLDGAMRRRADVEHGVLVAAVEPASDAARKGLHAGDVIVRANATAVMTPADLDAAIAAARRAGRDHVLVFVARDGAQVAIPVRLVAGEPR